jgi:hypothetical protein
MFIDPIVQEERNTREKIAAEYDYQIDILLEREKAVFDRSCKRFKIAFQEEIAQLHHQQMPPKEGKR